MRGTGFPRNDPREISETYSRVGNEEAGDGPAAAWSLPRKKDTPYPLERKGVSVVMCRESAEFVGRPFRGRYLGSFGLYGVRMGVPRCLRS